MGEEEAEPPSSSLSPCPLLRFDLPPRRALHFRRQFLSSSSENNFLKGLRWSPDGSSFLTSSEDNALRVFALSSEIYDDAASTQGESVDDEGEDSYGASVMVCEAESVYDFCWYPYMSAADPTSCVFASTTRDHPIHLWDALTGELRCTYRAYDAVDEIASALSIAFNSSGTKLFAGYNKCFRVFDVHRPGRDFQQYLLEGKEGFSGIVSSISFSAYAKMLAMGSYNQTTAIYAEDNMELLYVLHGQMGGVTQVLFSRDGKYLYSGGRRDPYILCWDVRNTANILYKLYRATESTNQRVMFDIEACGRHLGAGGQDGVVHIYDLQTGHWITGFQAASDTVNTFSFHPSLPLAASSSGHRRYFSPENSEENFSMKGNENCVSIWSFACDSALNNKCS